MKILHISEAYGGGITSAINSYAENSAQFEHFLFAMLRKNDSTGEEGAAVFKNIFFVDRNFKAISALYRLIKTLKPDVIHIHSTFAGVVCRLLPFIPKFKSIYTPHGFAFLRDDHPIMLKMFYLIENLLSNRCLVIAGCGLSERLIAESFIGPERAFELPNICDPLPDVASLNSNTFLPVVGMVGRISKQKGFDFFIETANALIGKAHFKWIGGGTEELESLLREAGIEVTGWINRAEVVGHLKGLDLYYHTAAWEGFPISVLEASYLHKPILLRSIEPFRAEALSTVKSAQEASREIQLWLEGEKNIIDQIPSVATIVNEVHSVRRLRNSLGELYMRFNDNNGSFE